MPYSPASVLTTTGTLAHLVSRWYDRVAVGNLKSNLAFVPATSRRRLPNANGKTFQIYSYDTFAANTTPGSEGTVGTGIAPTTVVREVTVQQYFDYVNFSDLLVETALDPIVENTAAELGYRAALSADRLARSEFEVAAAATAAARIDLADNEFLSAAIVRQAAMSLRGDDVKPQSDGMYIGIAHPFALFDLLNDNTAGGVIDILKYHESGAKQLQSGVQNEMRVVDVAGVRFIETTQVGSTAAFPSGVKVGYHTYVVGMDAIFTVSLGQTEIPEQRNFSLTARNWGPTKSDPAGVIGSSVAYNFKFAALRAPGTIVRLRQIRAESSIA